jgi:predicted O-linked N-acetylglucosamine transferase (SPINDLY family)
VQLPNLSIHYRKLDVTPATPDLAVLGIRPGVVKYLCCQSLYKYLPRNDDIYPRIAADVPEAQFLFLQHSWAPEISELTRKRLGEAFQTSGMDPAKHLVFMPPQDQAHYAGLNAAADVYLDSLEWSGGNTTLEAIAAGVPVVTLPGKLMRGRHSAGILNYLRIGDTIARDKDEYVAMAVRLGRDLWWRRAMADRIVARRDRL